MAKKKIRILVDREIDRVAYKCDDIVNVDAATAKTLVTLGAADDDLEAVKYALEKTGSPVIEHAPITESPTE